MAIVTQITRLEGAATIIKTKTAQLELNKDAKDGSGTVLASDKLDVQARAIAGIQKGTPVSQKLDGTTATVSIPAGYYGSASSVSVDTMTPSAVTLSGSDQTISCKDKMMTDNITIPAANVYLTGSGTPENSLGKDGDIYLVV